MANIFEKQNGDKVFDDGGLTIRGNLFVAPNGAVQIANVSRVYVDTMPQTSYLKWIVCAILGLALCSVQELRLLGVIMIILGGYMIYSISKGNHANKYGLFVELNSGKSLIFTSPDLNFLNNAADFLAKAIEGKLHASYYTINFTDQSIHDVTGTVVKDSQVRRVRTDVQK